MISCNVFCLLVAVIKNITVSVPLCGGEREMYRTNTNTQSTQLLLIHVLRWRGGGLNTYLLFSVLIMLGSSKYFWSSSCSETNHSSFRYTVFSNLIFHSFCIYPNHLSVLFTYLSPMFILYSNTSCFYYIYFLSTVSDFYRIFLKHLIVTSINKYLFLAAGVFHTPDSNQKGLLEW